MYTNIVLPVWIDREPKEMIRKADLLRPQIAPFHPLEAVFFHLGTSQCNII